MAPSPFSSIDWKITCLYNVPLIIAIMMTKASMSRTLKQASLSSWVWNGAGSPSLFWFAVEIAIIVANSSPDTWSWFFSHSTILMTMMLMQMKMIKDLSITISISGLEALPAEPVDLLVALRSSVSHLRSGAQGRDP